MKEQKINFKENEFLTTVEEFFDARDVTNYLHMVDHWMELLLGGKSNKRWGDPSQLYNFYSLASKLFESANDLINTPNDSKTIENNTTVKLAFLVNEKQVLAYFPYQLKQKELLKPFKVIKSLFKNEEIGFYHKTLNAWLAAGLSNNYVAENADLIIPLYRNTKRLIIACWLIHERTISKNSHKSPVYHNHLLNYALTEPSLFNKNEANDPFSTVEFFFNFTNLSGYREYLQSFYMAAINPDLCYKNPSTLYFIYNQYNSLLQAGYLIAAQKLNYVPRSNKYAGKTLGEWLFGVRDKEINEGTLELSDEMPHALSLQERANPMGYCVSALTHEHVIKLRFGLKEWFDAGISNQTSVHEVDDFCWYEFYLDLQKLTEAFYLIITANATLDQETKTNLNNEVDKN